MAQKSEDRKNQRARADSKKADAKRAEAEARRAESESSARRAEAEARALEARVKAEAEGARIAAERSKQEAADALAKQRADNKADSQGIRAAAQTAAIVVGLYAGHKLAHGIDVRHQATVAAQNPQIKGLGDRIGRSKPGAHLKSAAKAADKLRLTKTRGPLGLGFAVALVAEAAVARTVVSPGLDDAPWAQAATDAVATGSTIAAISMVGQAAINRATPAAVPDAVAMANIESARNGEVAFKAEKVKPETPADQPKKKAKAPKPIGPPAPGSTEALRLQAKAAGVPNAGKISKTALQKALSGAGRAALPVVAGVAAVSAFTTASQAGESNAAAAGEAALAAVDVVSGGAVSSFTTASQAGESNAAAAGEAALAVVDVVSGGAVSSFRDEKARGGSDVMAIIRGVVEGGANIVTMGLAGVLSSFSSGPAKTYVPESVARKKSGGAFLNDAAAAKATTVKKSSPTLVRMQAGGGWRNGRGFANKKVQAVAQAARRRSGK